MYGRRTLVRKEMLLLLLPLLLLAR